MTGVPHSWLVIQPTAAESRLGNLFCFFFCIFFFLQSANETKEHRVGPTGFARLLSAGQLAVDIHICLNVRQSIKKKKKIIKKLNH